MFAYLGRKEEGKKERKKERKKGRREGRERERERNRYDGLKDGGCRNAKRVVKHIFMVLDSFNN